jgi:hypothetical protein
MALRREGMGDCAVPYLTNNNSAFAVAAFGWMA